MPIHLMLFLSLASLQLLAADRISDIAATRHNLSALGTGTVKATSEGQICVFCHTPHHATNIPAAPLWNRQLSGATYTPYTSNSIDANDIAATPGGSSKLCLSCHDGTVAIGSVNVLDGTSPATISMQGVEAGRMPGGAGESTGFTRKLGTNLTNDHPISFTYDSVLANADGELRNPSLEPHIGNRVSGTSPPLVPLEDSKVQCISCHDPHIRDTDPTRNIKFLKLNRFQTLAPVGSGFNAQGDILCIACHDKLGQAWADSAHASPISANESYTAEASTLREFPTQAQVWQVSCLNCHDTHAVQGTRRLLREGTDSITSPKSGGNPAIEETCYQCHSDDGGVLTGQGGATFEVPDVKTDFTTGLRHMPITNLDQVAGVETHDISDGNLRESNTLLAGAGNINRHAECTDCHNPHRVVKNRLFNALGATTASTHEHAAGHTNIASGALRGSWGVEPVYASNTFDPSNLPVSYLIKEGDGGSGASSQVISSHVTREYQICFKCHSDYAYGANPPQLGDSGGSTPLGTNDMNQYTNQAMEFHAPLSHKGNPSTMDSGASSSYSTNNQRSWHPVKESTGRSALMRNASTTNWLAPWNSSADIGNQTMYCSDCHGSSTASGTVEPSGGENGNPWGPHGSNHDFILKGDWNQGTGTGQTNDLCFKCHSYTAYATDSGGTSGFGQNKDTSNNFKDTNLHAYHAGKIGNLRCSWCHTAVPHGWKNKALLVNLNDVGPEAGLVAGTQVRTNTTVGYTNGPYYLNAMLKVVNFAQSGQWEDVDCGSAGAPGNGEVGRDWMRDSSENCANPP